MQLQLDWLTLSNNAIVTVPAELACMNNLKEVKFDMNPLEEQLMGAYDRGLWDGLKALLLQQRES